jgi:hypothetical protein
MQEKFEGSTGVFRIRKSKKDRHYKAKRKRTKEQTKIYKAIHIKLKIE